MKTVLIDLDGVAANWNKRIKSKLDLPQSTPIDVINKHKNRKALLRSIYEYEPDFFSHLEKIQGFDDLLSMILEFKNELNVGWLSAIGDDHPNPEQVYRDKIIWIEENIDKVHNIDTRRNAFIVLRSSDKSFFANPDTFLIDDYEKNYIDFLSQRGNAFLIQEDRNDVSYCLPELSSCLRKFCEKDTS